MNWTYIFAGLSIVEFLLLIFLLFKKKKKPRKGSSSQNSNSSISQADLNYWKELHAKKSRDYNDLQQKLNELKFEKKVAEVSNDVQSIPDKPSETINLDVPKNYQKFYLSVPEDDKLFYKPDSTNEPMESSLYSFEIEKSNGGSFQVIDASKQTINLAFNSPETYLERVCQYDNALDPSVHKKIKALNKGEFIVEGDNVKITKKVLIKFI